MINKKCLALAISALVFSGTGNAAATFASEIDIAAGAVIASAGTLDVTNSLGFGVSATAVRYMRYDLSNGALFDGAIAVPTVAGAPGSSIIQSSGGTGMTYVIFQITAGADVPAQVGPPPVAPVLGAIASTAVVSFTPAAGVKLVNPGSVAMTYNHYEFAADAISQSNTLWTKVHSDFIQFSPALSLSCAPAAIPDKIDVAQSSTYFSGGPNDVTTDIGTLTVNFTTRLKVDGTPLANADQIINASSTSVKVSATGGWSAITGLSDTTANTFALSGGEFVDSSASLAAYSTGKVFTATADGTNPIESAVVTATIAPVAMSGYNVDTITGSCVLGSMSKNGSSDRINFMTKPNGAYKSFVRISNPSSTGGNVFLTAIDDSGTVASFPLSDVSGQPAVLNARASTGLITVENLALAAKAANAAYDDTTKMRVIVDAEFGMDGSVLSGQTIANPPALSGAASTLLASATTPALLGPALGVLVSALGSQPPQVGTVTGTINQSTGVNIQAFGLSKDNNSFFMMSKD